MGKRLSGWAQGPYLRLKPQRDSHGMRSDRSEATTLPISRFARNDRVGAGCRQLPDQGQVRVPKAVTAAERLPSALRATKRAVTGNSSGETGSAPGASR